MAEGKVRFGIIGFGNVAPTYLYALQNNPDSEVVSMICLPLSAVVLSISLVLLRTSLSDNPPLKLAIKEFNPKFSKILSE